MWLSMYIKSCPTLSSLSTLKAAGNRQHLCPMFISLIYSSCVIMLVPLLSLLFSNGLS